MHTNNQNNIKHIVIAGGGSAGWMTAAALAKQLGTTHYKITLVESKDIGTVSVGEATIPSIQEFNNMLGINEDEFLAYTHGTFKLGIQFVDWHSLGHSYMHPFGAYGVNMNAVPFHHYWLKDQLNGNVSSSAKPIQDYNLEYSAAMAGKFTRPIAQSRSPLANVRYAFHFDATLYADFLRDFACKLGVAHKIANITEVTQDPNNGNIQSLILSHEISEPATLQQEELHGDLFIDCSGFKGLLIAKTLGVEFDDWREFLPCDSAYAQPSQALNTTKPYTISTAHSAGWQWQIPLQHRIGNGLVFSSEFMSDTQAQQLLSQQLPSSALAEPRKLQWVNGKRHKAWEKNCVAIGLSAGFIEPLESTGLQLIQSAIFKLLSLFPGPQCLQADIDTFNRFTDQEFMHIRDFIVLHYKATARNDSEFWRYCQHMPIPDSLAEKIALYEASGRIYRDSNELFNEISWFSVLNGQGIMPSSYHPFVDLMDEQLRQQNMQKIAGAMQESVAAMPTHDAFIQRYCRAKDL